jgi:hypothetical protein
MHSGHLASDGVGLGHSDRAKNPHNELEGVMHADGESKTESALWEVGEPEPGEQWLRCSAAS